MLNKPSRSQSNPIFIVGTQRSGTTLLRLILNAHSQIAIPEEARFLMPLFKQKYLKHGISSTSMKTLVSYLSQNDQYKLWNYDPQEFLLQLSQMESIGLGELIDSMFTSFCRSEGKTIWGDKSLFFRTIGVLNTLFPEARFIHIVRDGRDVFDSWRKMDPSKNNASVIALDWSYKIFKIEKSFSRMPSGHTFTLRYEDLLEKPEEVIKEVCTFLNVGYEPAMLDFYKTSHFYIGEHHSDLIFNAINRSNTAKWHKNLTPLEIKSFNLLAGHYLKKHHYEIADAQVRPGDSLRIGMNLLTGIPKRIGQVVYSSWAGTIALRKGGAEKSLPVGVMPKEKKSSEMHEEKM